MKNERTPRTLSECEYTTGYPTVPRPAAKGSVWLAILLCLVAGVSFGVLIALGVPRG